MKVKKYISIFLGLCGLGLMPVGTYAKTIVNPVMVNPFAKIESGEVLCQINEKQPKEWNINKPTDIKYCLDILILKL